MKKSISIFILLIFICSCERYNQESIIVIGNPDTSFYTRILDGYFVTSIAFDHKGNAWIGTFKQGLIKYNPSETKVYDWNNSIIPENTVINDIAIDSHDNVWIGCSGLIKFDGNRFTYFNTGNSPIPADYVNSIAIDSKDNIWFTSCRFRAGGLVKFDGSSWNVFTPQNSELPVNFIRSVAVDRNDNVWLALSEIVNESYLIKITGSDWSIYRDEDLGFNPYYFSNIVCNSRNQVCGAIDYVLSSSFVNVGPQVFVFNGHESEQLSFDDVTNVMSIAIDDEDNIWCANVGGYSVYNGERWVVDDSTFHDTGVFTIEQARDRKIWLGTSEGIYIN